MKPYNNICQAQNVVDRGEDVVIPSSQQEQGLKIFAVLQNQPNAIIYSRLQRVHMSPQLLHNTYSRPSSRPPQEPNTLFKSETIGMVHLLCSTLGKALYK